MKELFISSDEESEKIEHPKFYCLTAGVCRKETPASVQGQGSGLVTKRDGHKMDKKEGTWKQTPVSVKGKG